MNLGSLALPAAATVISIVAPVAPRPTALAQATAWAKGLNAAPLSLPPVVPVAKAFPSQGPPGDATGYERLRLLFETASERVPGPEGFLRWRAGRLFKAERPDEPLNSLLVGAEVELPGGGRGQRLFPVQTFRPVDEIPSRPDLQQWVRDLIRATPAEGPGPEFGETSVRFGICRGGICHAYEVRSSRGLLLLRYQAAPEAGGPPIATWYGYYDKDVTPPPSGGLAVGR